MNPAKLSIQGDYWDCQLYRGRLYLFLTEGSVKVIDWNQLIDSIIHDDYLKVAIKYSFTNGSILYNSEMYDLLADNQVRDVLREKFDRLLASNFEIAEGTLNQFLIGEQDNPFKELQNDSDVFNNRLYALTHNSLLTSTIHKPGLRNPISSKPQKLFDLYGFTCKANNYSRIAVSAGADGLMEYNASPNFYTYRSDERMRTVSQNHSSFSDYSFLSIYNSSLEGASCLALQKWEPKRPNQKARLFKVEDIPENDIFSDMENAYLSWGYKEKIYRAVQGGIQLVRFNNYAGEDERAFSEAKFIPFQPWKGKILSAATAYYGTILQCENAIVVMKSDGTFFNIPGEITRYRIYPRSFNYENHLHVIHNDRLEIYSFNHDYFVTSQINKDFGVAYKEPKVYRGRYYVPDDDFYTLDDDIGRPGEPSQNNNNNITDDLPF